MLPCNNYNMKLCIAFKRSIGSYIDKSIKKSCLRDLKIVRTRKYSLCYAFGNPYGHTWPQVMFRELSKQFHRLEPLPLLKKTRFMPISLINGVPECFKTSSVTSNQNTDMWPIDNCCHFF